MKRILLATTFALAACSGQPAASNEANETNAAGPLSPIPAEPVAPVNDAAPATNEAGVGDSAEGMGRARPDRPYQPLPADTSPPPRPAVDDRDGDSLNEIE